MSRSRNKRFQFSNIHSNITGKRLWSFTEFKSNSNGCVICGYNRCASALEFHHLDKKSKHFSISVGQKRYTYNTIKQEIDKCCLVCANCHRELEEGLIHLEP